MGPWPLHLLDAIASLFRALGHFLEGHLAGWLSSTGHPVLNDHAKASLRLILLPRPPKLAIAPLRRRPRSLVRA